MCSSCGCGIPEELHADPRNILFSQLTAAAEAQGIAVNDVVNNMHAMAHQSHKVDLKPQPEPIKDAKTKMLTKNWDLWDAEHEGFGRASIGSIVQALKKAGHQHYKPTKALYNHRGEAVQSSASPRGFKADNHFSGRFVRVRHEASLYDRHDPKKSSAAKLQEYKKTLEGRGYRADFIDHPSDPELQVTKKTKTKDKVLRKTVMTMSDYIVDAIEKGQRRDETGKFHPGKDNVHSHKMGKEIVTHSHDGEKGHTHPTRKYGPSFNHQ